MNSQIAVMRNILLYFYTIININSQMNMLRFLYIVTLYFLLSTLTKQKEGPQQNEANQIQTGQFQFSNDNSKSTELRYKLPLIKLKTPENIKIALSLIFLQKFYLASGIQFFISPQVSTSIEAVLTYNLTMQWKIVRVAYLMTNRIDIDCGYFSISNDNLNSANEEDLNQTILIESGNYTNRKPLDSSKKRKAIIWISGLKCSDSKFSISFSSPIINTLSNPNFIFFTLKVFNKTSPIYMQLSYIIFHEQGRLNFQRLPSSNSFIQQNIEAESQFDQFSIMTSFLGADLENLFSKNKGPIWEKFDVGGKQVISSDILSQIRTIFQIVECGIKMREVLQVYFSPNLNFSDPKFKSLDKDKKTITFDECKQMKGQIIETKRMKQVCSICSPNETFDISCLKCVCVQGYTQVDKICYKNQQLCEVQNSIIQNEKCFIFLNSLQICRLRNQVYNQRTKRCQCDNNSIQRISPVDGKPYCMGKCPKGAVFNFMKLSCQCLHNYQLRQNRCVKCGPMYEWYEQNGVKEMCQCKQESHRKFPEKLCLRDKQDHKDYTQYVQIDYSTKDW